MDAIDPTIIIIDTIGAVLALYAAWENLINKRISRFGLDSLLLVIFGILDKKQTLVVRQSPKLIQRMGWMLLLIGVGGVYAIILELT